MDANSPPLDVVERIAKILREMLVLAISAYLV